MTANQWQEYVELTESSAESELHLPTTDVAQKTRVVHLPKLLSAEEVEQVHTLHQHLKPLVGSAGRRADNQAAAYRSGAWETDYLSTDGHFARCAPQLREKLLAAALKVDKEHWQLVQTATGSVAPRCVEYHTVEPGGSLNFPTHHDGGSLVTIDVMLSDRDEFDGGHFGTLECDGTTRKHPFDKGDAVVFVSHKFHSVSPVTAGRRHVLVMEIWEGEECESRRLEPENPNFITHHPALSSHTRAVPHSRRPALARRRTCAHRCEKHRGHCGHTASSSFWRRAMSDLASDL